MAGQKAADAFTEWAKANTTKIHADAIDEAAMGFAAGWDTQEAQVARLRAAAEEMEKALRAYNKEAARIAGGLISGAVIQQADEALAAWQRAGDDYCPATAFPPE